MVMMHVFSRLAEKMALEVVVLSVDHGLRPESSGEVDFVLGQAQQMGLAARGLRVDLPPGGNVQARARKARYVVLEQAADESLGPGSLVVTAHHADDRAETVLLRLLRGSSLAGLNVLPALSGRRFRPLIRSSRKDVVAHQERFELPHADDSSNRNSRFLRVRVRQELLPLLESLAPGMKERLCRLADEAGALEEEPLGLNHEQRAQLRRALSGEIQGLELPLGGGLRITSDPGPRTRSRGGGSKG